MGCSLAGLQKRGGHQMNAADRELVATLRTIHRVENPRAVDRLCREAADRIEQLSAPEPKRRGRPPKHQTITADQ